MSKLDEVLLRAISEHQRRSAARTGPGSAESAESADESDTVQLFVEFTGPVDGLTPLGFHAQSVQPVPRHGLTVAAGWMPVESLPRLQDAEQVIRATGARPVSPQLDHSRDDSKVTAVRAANSTLTGAGVLVGIIDSGIDLYHPTLRNTDGTSRILTVWDMRHQPRNGESEPRRLNSGVRLPGVEYRKSRDPILHAKNPSTGGVPHPQTVDPTSHGTHVAGIAAGNGRGSPAGTDYTGMAPEADLVVVCLPDEPKDVHVANAFKYIWREAQDLNLPSVINMSLGRPAASDDENPTPWEKAISAGVEESAKKSDTGIRPPPRAVVVAAGNEGMKSAVFALDSKNPTKAFTFRVQPGFAVEIELTGPFTQLRRVEVTGPSRTGSKDVDISQKVGSDTWTIDGTSVFVQYVHPTVTLFLTHDSDATPTGGTWSVSLSLKSNFQEGSAGDFTARYAQGPGRFENHISGKRTIVIPARISEVITVGAYHSRDHTIRRSERVVTMSSRGPVDGSNPSKPDLVAPGADIMSALYHPPADTQGPLWGRKSGTSMAAPHVAGVVALLLQRHPTATFIQVRDALRNSARRPTDSSGQDVTTFESDDWGKGILDAQDALAKLENNIFNPPPPSATTASSARSLPSAARTGETSDRTTPEDLRTLWAALATAADHRAGRPSLARWAARISRHLAELERLLTHQPTLAAHWHQADGPALLRWLTHTLTGSPDHPEPPDPAVLTEHLDALLTELEHVGSPRLRRDATRCRHELATTPPTTLTATLTAHPPHTAGQHR
ncbi:S8 family serine peptidase [Phycicoccus sp. CSK15P-2]|uniref:S8 family serine peptidase n=1 Tax=Phycicoccus sp. CSK15P-2 TaxID=2807627 RepID=UPI001951A473|nr:S8 family serine peptidase [Phycicoccus sp. CSK15P-2]MBM6406014.1 S8 family serine peptidase [Phycicoccus sp. CSK15P-2]